ncbi:hypothetical protein [Corynebacterium sp.]|uniref:hypothetical protein n=1 Tax=Corynebacterium sp. TaxID=1720 RepID=UPI0028A6C2D5|nr:hypothetical protein [Corynebacterium sp.]
MRNSEALKAEAQRRMQGDQLDLGLDLGDSTPPPVATGTADQPWEVTAQRSGYLLDAIATAPHRAVGLDRAAADDSLFEGLVTARIIEPGSKYDSIRVLDEAGAHSASYGGNQTPPAALRDRPILPTRCPVSVPTTPASARPHWCSTT